MEQRIETSVLVKQLIFAAVCCMGGLVNGLAQDVHFSQFYHTPLLVNPGLTGVFPGDQRVLLNYKDQWTSFGTPYKTYAFSIDAALLQKNSAKTSLGAGLMVYNDVAGDARLGTAQVNAALSAIRLLDDKNIISAGIMGGFAQHSINEENFEWGNQFDKGVYNPSLSSGEPLQSFEPFFYGDAAAGINWNYSRASTNMSANNNLIISAGVAAFHVNQPKQKYFELNEVEQLHAKLVGHAGADIGIKNTNISLKPSFIYMLQGPAQEINLGMMFRYTLKEESKYTGFIKETAVSLGAYSRLGDAVIPAILFELSSFAIGVTYDVNISGLSEVSKGRGGIEISLRYINPNPFKLGKEKRYKHRSLF